jgi:hypothetical protein
MAKTTPEQNKAILLDAFDTLFNKRDYAAGCSEQEAKTWAVSFSMPLAVRKVPSASYPIRVIARALHRADIQGRLT